jgi:hypothetical protein
MYKESPHSLEKRLSEIVLQKEKREHFATRDERPTKKQRRQIHQFKRGNNS